MNNKTKDVIARMGDLSIAINRNDSSNWGVLFNSYQTESNQLKDEAFTLASNNDFSGIVRWSEYGKLDYNPKAPFFSIQEEDFMRNQLKLNPEEIKSRMFSAKFKSLVKIPYGNLVNHLNKLTDSEKERSRVIIKANHGEVEQGLTLLKAYYDKGFDRMVLRHRKAEQLFVPHKDSAYRQEDLEEGKIYQCSVDIGEDNKEHIVPVNVKYRVFVGVQVMIYTSEAGYLPKSIDEVINSNYYHPDMVLNIPFIGDSNYDFPPTMLDCYHLNMLLVGSSEGASVYAGFRWLEFHMGETPVDPVMIVGDREDESYPLIETLMMPLDPTYRGDKR